MNVTAELEEVLDFLCSGKYELVVEIILRLYELVTSGGEVPCSVR